MRDPGERLDPVEHGLVERRLRAIELGLLGVDDDDAGSFAIDEALLVGVGGMTVGAGRDEFRGRDRRERARSGSELGRRESTLGPPARQASWRRSNESVVAIPISSAITRPAAITPR